MNIPDITPTDVTKNIISLLVVAAWLYLSIQGAIISPTLEIAFVAVMAAYGISVAKPVIAGLVAELRRRPQGAKPDANT